MSENDDSNNRLIAIMIIVMAVVFLAVGLLLHEMSNKLQERIDEIEQDGRAQERQYLEDLKNTKTCQMATVIYTKHGGPAYKFWDESISDEMTRIYLEKCDKQ